MQGDYRQPESLLAGAQINFSLLYKSKNEETNKQIFTRQFGVISLAVTFPSEKVKILWPVSHTFTLRPHLSPQHTPRKPLWAASPQCGPPQRIDGKLQVVNTQAENIISRDRLQNILTPLCAWLDLKKKKKHITMWWFLRFKKL